MARARERAIRVHRGFERDIQAALACVISTSRVLEGHLREPRVARECGQLAQFSVDSAAGEAAYDAWRLVNALGDG
jgi:hypothetical protein